MNNFLNSSLLLSYTQLSNFSDLKNFWNLFDTVFGTQYNHTVAATLHSQWQSGDFSQFPQIEIISNSIFEDTNPGYASSTNKIYLSDSFVATAKPEEIKAVLLTEIGNFVQSLVQANDTPGDKGAIFAELVLKNSSTQLEPTSVLQTTLIQAIQSNKSHNLLGCGCSSCMLPPVKLNLVDTQQPQLAQTVSAGLDLSKTFSLNSLLGANQTIYLDFNGHTTSGTYWNTDFAGGANIVTPAFDFDSNAASFSSTELERIQYIWQRVAEDFSPFNVNVTTQAPTDINDLIKSSSTDTRWGVRVVIGGSSYDWFGNGAGGVAYLDSFNDNTDTPAYVFSNNLQNSEKYTAEAISHEVGHTLGLEHDGRINPGEGYYSGHGSGVTGWAGIMGSGYYQNLTQWSKGEYASANNTEDDLQIITTYNGFSYRTDDAGNTITTAKSLAISGTSVSGNGIIERNTDVDFYSFVTGAGAINLTVNPFSRGPNLDILAKLYNSAGTLIASSNPTDLLSAAIATTVTAGTYYLAIDGVGKGDPLSTGYTDYGSLGQYFISGSIVSGSSISSNPTTVSLALSSTSVNEDGSSNLVYTFTRSGSTTNVLTVNYSVGGTATFNSDYSQLGATSFTATTGTITFTAGANTATLTIDPTADTTFETNENVTLTLAAGSGYTIGTTTGVTGIIVNDDLPTITLSVSSTSVNEDGSSNLIYTFTRSGSNINALTVNYGVGGTATFNSDYSQLGATSFTATNGTITFAAGASTATLTIDPIADTTFETNENVTLTLATGSEYKIGTTTGLTRSIVNDDLRPTINLSSSQTIVEGNTNLQNVTYLVTLTNASSQTITVYYSTANGSATAGLDYTATAGTLTFNPGVTSQVINIPILNDSLNEADESFILSLKSPTNATLGTATSVTTTITDTLITSVTATLPTNVENLTLTGTAAINGTGNVGNNILTGNSGNNTLTGEDGNDTYLFSAITLLGTDRIVETTTGGIDTIDFRGTTISSNVNLGITTTQTINNNLNLILSANNVIENATGGIGNDSLTGNALNNILSGGNGNDQLQGLAGDDTLWGGVGDDILTGGEGKDKYLFQAEGVFTASLGVDYITDFEGGQDKIVLSKSTFKAITNSAGQTLTDFAVVTDDQFVNASSRRIVYSQSTGSLFYNQDGNILGTGTVFEFARLGNSGITLASSDFSLIA
ncbi:M10 family metallopeptidase C-terminal domain-containing protein [Nostoc sp. LEGE 06077]|uniref:Calx-beta domain-containing protein n=1 Tax=Nostoc sp. LEGE 06077 TaxID=915325 RepID=UPI0018801015|nr:Calx-beta domain-containing protein [Nostoc sp. LEGE 06077]MBE9208688.1 M10 family metallopeptidase C-terminal domain-containing protein [Nostoc sp. LEGE 06077]